VEPRECGVPVADGVTGLAGVRKAAGVLQRRAAGDAFNQLPHWYKHSPTIVHNALAALYDAVKVPLGVCMHQSTDDILVAGGKKEQLGQVAETICNLLMENGLDLPPSKCQGPGQGIKF